MQPRALRKLRREGSLWLAAETLKHAAAALLLRKAEVSIQGWERAQGSRCFMAGETTDNVTSWDG